MTRAGIFRRADRRFLPWKNGGGDTAEIVVVPAGAGFDDFDWRISTARVARSGPFSVFEGVDRVLSVLEGGPMTIRVAATRRRLDAASTPFAFAGDLPCTAELEGEALLDLNLMVRRPLRAVVRRGVIARPAGTAIGAYALVTRPAPDIGLEPYDLVDLLRAGPDLIRGLLGTQGIVIEIDAP